MALSKNFSAQKSDAVRVGRALKDQPDPEEVSRAPCCSRHAITYYLQLADSSWNYKAIRIIPFNILLCMLVWASLLIAVVDLTLRNIQVFCNHSFGLRISNKGSVPNSVTAYYNMICDKSASQLTSLVLCFPAYYLLNNINIINHEG